jgi:KDO2-lipid IV(A) lauroyltransferase
MLYVVGSAIAIAVPRRISFWIARHGADYWSHTIVPNDRESVRKNLQAVLGAENVPDETVSEVFRNFAMYLVDFFRSSHVKPQDMRRMVKIEGLDNMKGALARGKGAIGLTAHIGNFELAGAVLSYLGLPINAVVLSHQNPYVDKYFIGQRKKAKVNGIPVQKLTPRAFFDSCMGVLRRGEVLALVGDRDFFNHGVVLPLFGKSIKIPTGPASFSLKTGAPIVPGFMLREKDGSYRLILEEPILPPQGLPREEAVRVMSQACLDVMAKYIRQYPTQWYGFKEFWRQIPAVVI